MTKRNLRLASYNIRKARGLDQRRMPERILDVLNGLDADIVVLQEADKRLGQRIAALPHDMIERETDLRVVDVARNDVSLGWHGNAVLARAGLTPTDVRLIDLPGLEPRGAVAVDFEAGAGVTVVAAHLGLMRRHRQDQLTHLRNVTEPMQNCVILGDFNEWSPSKGLEPLQGRFAVHSPGLSFHARRPLAALDRIALSENLRLQGAGVDESVLARRASDHLPVWADIAISSHG